MNWPSSAYFGQCLAQDWLRSGRSLADLTRQFKLTAKRHGTYTNLIQLKYDQIESDFNEPMVRQCRGLILDEGAGHRIVARPFDKFFNYGEPLAAPINWKTATIQEKLDGSLMIMYWWKDAWHVATSGTPDASGEIGPFGIRFAELFWSTWRQMKFPMPATIHQQCTWMFELTSPHNRIVVKHDKAALRLIGLRNNLTGAELPVRNFSTWNPVKEFAPCDLEMLLASLDTIDPLQQEGYVVVDRDFNRIKVKHPGYVALHHMRSSLSPRNILEVIRKGEASEVIASFPEWRETFEETRASYEALCDVLHQSWEEFKHVEPRKSFAELALTTPMPAILFLLKDGKVANVREAMKQMHIDRLVDVLKLDTQAPTGLEMVV